VRFFNVIEQFERVSKFLMHRVGAVSDDVKSAALQRSVRTKRGNDNMTAFLYRPPDLFDVFSTVVFFCKEMKNRSVVPDIEFVFR